MHQLFDAFRWVAQLSLGHATLLSAFSPANPLESAHLVPFLPFRNPGGSL
jgi:hypothetical protein